MSTPPGEYYTEERWQNWLDRLREEDIDLESEESGRLLTNLQNDAAIAVAKVVTDHDDGDLDEEAALRELDDIRAILLSEVDLDDEDKLMLVDGVQTSLDCALHSSVHYIVEGPADGGTLNDYVQDAAAAEDEEDLETAFGNCVHAGTLVLDGEHLEMATVENLEYGYVTEWISGLDSLETAMADPEVVEEEGAEEAE